MAPDRSRFHLRTCKLCCGKALCLHNTLYNDCHNFVFLPNFLFQFTGNITLSISAAQRERMDMEMKEDTVYEVPSSMTEMKECEAYAPLPNRS